MTTTSVTHVEQLAQSVYDFVNNRLPDHMTPVLNLLASLNLDRTIYMKLESEITSAINDTEYDCFLHGFTMAKAIENVPLFAPSGD